MKTTAASLLIFVLAGLAEGGELPKTAIDARNLSEHVRILASDEYEGRAPASPGETKAIAYISEQFSKLGLTPAGDKGGWTQAVPLRKIELTQPATLRIKAGSKTSVLKNGDEAAFASLANRKEVELTDAPLVFVGYGVSAPELGWDDFKDVDLKGKVAVILVNDPDFEAPAPGKFGGKAMTYYGRWSYKYEEAARRGAAAALIVHEDAPAAYGWSTVQNSWLTPKFDIVREGSAIPQVGIQGWLRRDVAVRLLKKARLNFAELKKQAMQPDFRPVPLNGVTLSAKLSLSITPVLSHNIVAKLPGKERAQDSVIYSGHWDHLGIGKPDSTGDTIYHGAADNAVGVASVLELARVFASAPPPVRSIYFVAFTAEEKGLLGAEYYALHPPAGLDRTVAVLNIDMLSLDGASRDVSIRGGDNSSLYGSYAIAVEAQGRTVSPESHPEAGYFYRADHFPFAKMGVPGISISSGQDRYEGGTDAGQKAYEDFIAHRYHQPADKWSPDLDFSGVAIDVDALYTMGRELANSADWPQWKEGSEFKRTPAR